MTRDTFKAKGQPPAEAQAQGGGEVRHEVEDVLCQAAALAERINYSADHDEAVTLSAELRQLLKKARSIRNGLSLFRTAPPSAPVGVTVWLREQDVTDLSEDKPWTAGAQGEFNQRRTDEFTVAFARVPAADCTCPHQDAREPDHDAACPTRSTQQPAPVAPVGVEGLPERCRREAPQAKVDSGEDAACAYREAVYWCVFQLEAALAQQPAAVDEEMVERALSARAGSWTVHQLFADEDEAPDIMRIALTAALAAQQGGRSDD